MFAARLCRIPLTTFVSGVGKQTVNKPCMYTRFQSFTNETGPRTSRIGQKKGGTSMKEKLMAPAGETAFSIGQGVVAGASALSLGALCYYGLGMSKELGAIDNAVLWPQEVRQRIRSTYMYFAGSIGLTALSAIAVSKSPALMNQMMKMRTSFLAFGASIAVMIGSGSVLRSIPYKEGFGTKQLALMAHCGIMGTVIATITMHGGPLLLRAAWYTAGIVGGLSAVAMCAPNEKFLNMAGPLACGLGVVILSCTGTYFLPPSTALGAGVYSIAVYGGLVLFGLFLLYDTQKVIEMAENHPVYSPVPFDPVNACLGIYMDTLNIFVALKYILANGIKRK